MIVDPAAGWQLLPVSQASGNWTVWSPHVERQGQRQLSIHVSPVGQFSSVRHKMLLVVQPAPEQGRGHADGPRMSGVQLSLPLRVAVGLTTAVPVITTASVFGKMKVLVPSTKPTPGPNAVASTMPAMVSCP